MGILGLCDRPIIVAPMAGGPSTPGLVAAAANAGALGFVAGGYKTPDQVHDEIRQVRSATTGAFGVNVFVPGAPTREEPALAAYLLELVEDANALSAELGAATWDDDHWPRKVEVLLDTVPPLVSFTFGCPPPTLVEELKRRGSIVMVTATNRAEAHQAVAVGAGLVGLQGAEAGAHRSTYIASPGPDLSVRDLLSAVARDIATPLVVAGGVAHPDTVVNLMAAGAAGVQAGTAFLRCPESGAHPLHKDALIDPQFRATTFTKSFSGRRARGLTNGFMRRHTAAPEAYPEINNATRPLRAAAANEGNPHFMSLWAGTGHRQARTDAAADIVEWLAP